MSYTWAFLTQRQIYPLGFIPEAVELTRGIRVQWRALASHRHWVSAQQLGTVLHLAESNFNVPSGNGTVFRAIHAA